MEKLQKLSWLIIACLILLSALPDNRGSNTCKGTSSAMNLKSDTEIIFFPSYAVQNNTAGSWQVWIHAWVYEPERNSVKRKILIDIIKKDLGLIGTDIRAKNFETMAGYLLVDQEGSKEVWVTVGGRNFCMGHTDHYGHVESMIIVQENDVKKDVEHNGGARYIAFHAQTSSNPNRYFKGKARMLEKSGIMVISDIDDTIKITNVRDRQMLIENTFYKPFEPVPGMPQLFKTIALSGSVFHYVTASPWQLYPPLAVFLQREGFPEGLFHMKYFSFSKNLSSLFAPSESVKKPYIMNLMRKFPEYRFIFFGDSGEQDPEIYGECARMNPAQVIGVYIRNVTDETHTNERMIKAFSGIPSGIWRLFKDVKELHRELSKLNE